MKFFDRVRVATTTLGQGTLSFGAATSPNMMTPAEAGALEGDETTYVIDEGADFEIGRGVIGAGSATMTRATVLRSKIGGVAGTAKMSLAGNAKVRFVQSAQDINDPRPIATGGTGATTAIGAYDAIVTAGTSITSATTLNLDGATGFFVDVTGNTEISAVTLGAGKSRLVRFTGSPRLKVGSSLIGNGNGRDIISKPGDIAMFEGLDGGLVSFWLVRASGRPVRPTTAPENNFVNPTMQISQENGNTAWTGTNSLYYVADQWIAAIGAPAANITIQRVQVANPGGSNNRIRVTVNTAQAALDSGSYFFVGQRMEGNRIAKFKFGTADAMQLVIRFGVKAPAGTYSVAVRNNPAATRSFVAQFTITAAQANIDTVKEVAIPGDMAGAWATGTSIGMEVDFVFAAGSSFQAPGAGSWQGGTYLVGSGNSNGLSSAGNVFEVFECGHYLNEDETGVAPEFEVPDYAFDLWECQRYWQQRRYIWSGMTTVGNTYYVETAIGPTLRAAPAITLAEGNAFGFAPTGTGVEDYTTTGAVRLRHVANATAGVGYFQGVATINARM